MDAPTPRMQSIKVKSKAFQGIVLFKYMFLMTRGKHATACNTGSGETCAVLRLQSGILPHDDSMVLNWIPKIRKSKKKYCK